MEIELELWKPIPEFPDYAASNLGRIKRVTADRGTYAGKILKQKIVAIGRDRSYYLPCINIRQDKMPVTKAVHRLVAAAWLGPCPKGKEVNHKNGDTLNPKLDNLEYMTKPENNLHAFHILGRKPASGKNDHALSQEVRDEIRKRFAAGEQQIDLAKEFNVGQSCISSIINSDRIQKKELKHHLIDEEVLAIRAKMAAGNEDGTSPAPQLAIQYNVSKSTIFRIAARQIRGDL